LIVFIALNISLLLMFDSVPSFSLILRTVKRLYLCVALSGTFKCTLNDQLLRRLIEMIYIHDVLVVIDFYCATFSVIAGCYWHCVITGWHSLSNTVVTAPSTVCFKRRVAAANLSEFIHIF